MIPIGLCFLISSSFELQGRTTEKTFCSRTRRAISCEYCAPKSSTTIEGGSTNEFLREFPPSKERSCEDSAEKLLCRWLLNSASEPFANYLQLRVQLDPGGERDPAPEARIVVSQIAE